VWGNTAAQRGIIHQEDVEDGLKAAAAVGDDHIQKMSRGAVSPESFTHGSSAQRQQWFTRGLQSGDVNRCNTFQDSGGGSF
jgi:predicted metalloprotease